MSIPGNEVVIHKPKSSYHYKIDKIKDLRPGYKYILHDKNGTTIKRLRKHPKKEIFKITLENNLEVFTSGDNLNYIRYSKDKDILFKTTTTMNNSDKDIYMPYLNNKLSGVGGVKKLSYIFGVFYEYGTLDEFYAMVLSLPNDKKGQNLLSKTLDKLNTFIYPTRNAIFGEPGRVDNIVLRVSDRAIINLCNDFLKLQEKKNPLITGRFFNMTIDFNIDFINGVYDANKFVFNNKEQVKDFIGLVSNLNFIPFIEKDKDKYHIKLYTSDEYIKNRINFTLDDNLKEYFFEDKYYKWIKIKSIEKIEKSNVYTFESIKDEPNLFQLYNSGILINTKEL